METANGSDEGSEALGHLSQASGNRSLRSFSPTSLLSIPCRSSRSSMASSMFDSNPRAIRDSLDTFLTEAAGAGSLAARRDVISRMDQYWVSSFNPGTF